MLTVTIPSLHSLPSLSSLLQSGLHPHTKAILFHITREFYVTNFSTLSTWQLLDMVDYSHLPEILPSLRQLRGATDNMLHLHFSWSYRLLNHLERERGREKSRLPTPPFLLATPPSSLLASLPCSRRLPSGKGARESGRGRGGTQTAALYSLNTHWSLSEVKGLSGWHIVCE